MRWHTTLLATCLVLPLSLPVQAQYPPAYPRPYPQQYPPNRYQYAPRPPTPAQPSNRTVWVYGQGDQFNFRRMPDGSWIQDAADARYYFQEVARGPNFVELYDASRNIGARLTDDGLWTRAPGNDQFTYSLPGHWAY
jgi:hypothetical protein